MLRSIVLLLFVLFSFIPAQTPIAVLDLSAEGISGSEARTLTDRLRTELFNTGQYTVIEREMMDDILNEQGLQQSGCTSTECIVEVGRLIGVEQVIGGSIGKVGNVYSISAQTISVETGQIIRVATYDHMGELGDLLRFGMKNVALVLSGEKDQTASPSTIPFVLQEQKVSKSTQDIGIRDRGISINPAGVVSQLFTSFQLYGLTYEQFITPSIALSLRLDYLIYYEEWDEGDYYGEFSAEGFSLGASLLYYFSNTGEMNGFYGEVAVEMLSTYWEDIEYDQWGGEYLSDEGQGGFALVAGGGWKIPIREKYYFNPHLLIGIGSMAEVKFIAFPALSIGMKF
ncbi:MAG: hypothetical protein H8E14_16430 [Candidatus Marinimicrobia bacterium]|nr:hypothetical protein [Candidatus Neomarinimicrobiota bacterium]